MKISAGQIAALKQFFLEEYGLNLTVDEIFEAYQALIHLAKAIVLFNQYTEEVVHE